MGKDGGQGKFFPKYFDKRLACHLNSLCTCIMLIPQSCPTLCNFMDYSLSDSSVHGILQERILAAAAAKSLQSCLTLCNPRDSSPPGSPSLGFSRQEFWSGLQFPFPMHESEVAQSCLTLRDPMDCSLPGSSIHGIFQVRVLE